MKNWEKGRNQEKEGKRDERKNGKEKIQHISNQNSKMKFQQERERAETFSDLKKDINPQSININKSKLIQEKRKPTQIQNSEIAGYQRLIRDIKSIQKERTNYKQSKDSKTIRQNQWKSEDSEILN